MEKKYEMPRDAREYMEKLAARIRDEKVRTLFRTCYSGPLETTIDRRADGSVFLYTGDIPAMWNRDSTQQLMPYLPLTAESEEMRALVRGALTAQLEMIGRDSYANSFNDAPVGHHYAGTDIPRCGDWTWEQKYETDTLCYPLRLACLYYAHCGDGQVFDELFARTFERIVDQFILEQRHEEQSAYTHSRRDATWQDTLQNGGRGYRVNYTGMTWQGFRPSDDATVFGYHIPSNLMIAAVVRQVLAVNETLGFLSGETAARAARLREEILHGVETFGVVDHYRYGKIYAYETDGFGNHVLMDDANVPSLLSLPYLGCCAADDPMYLRTRRFILSEDNPYYFRGSCASGVGSPHTPSQYVWAMALAMQGFTAATREEMKHCLDLLVVSDGGRGRMHEGFDVNDPTRYTREWFTASDAFFAEYVEFCAEKGIV